VTSPWDRIPSRVYVDYGLSPLSTKFS
jgi:hypothetical protein